MRVVTPPNEQQGGNQVKEKYVLFVNTFCHFAISSLNTSHSYCYRKHINSYDTNVLKQILRTLRFCLVNIFIQIFFSIFCCIFLSLYFMFYMTGLPLSLWDSEHEHNTVNMLCCLKKNCHITNPTSPQRPPLYKGHFLLSPRWPLWRGLTVHKMYKILMY